MRHRTAWTLVLGLTLAATAPALAGPDDPELEVGKKAPAFELLGVDGKKHALAEYLGAAQATAVVFTCNTCPYSQAYEPVLLEMAATYDEKPVQFVLINPNAAEVQPGDSYEAMVARAKDKKYPFAYLHDATQAVATAYGAQRTPHVFLLDKDGVCRYRGRIDDTVKREEVKTHDLAVAIDALLAGKEVPATTTKAFGCTIKWRKAS